MIIRKLEALFGFRIDTAQFNKATSAVDDFADNANNAMGALAGHFAVQTIKDFVDSTTQAMADVGRMAGMLGVSTQSLEELRYAAEKSGVSVDTLDDSLKELQIRAVDAKGGSGEAADAFSIATMRREARELGYTLDEDTIESAIRFRQAVTSLKAVLGALVRNVKKSLLPALTSFVQGSASRWMAFSATFSRINESTSILRTIFIRFGIVLAGVAIKAVIAFAPMIAIGALIAGVALIIDDLWTAFFGGESVSKRVFETIYAWFSSLQSWIGNVVGRIWDFLPKGLRQNLQAAFALAKSYFDWFSSFIVTIFRRAWGFIAEEFPPVFVQIKNIIIKSRFVSSIN